MRIRRVEAKGLFDMFDHRIDFNLADRVTIMLGPNGIGKSWMLRMLAAALTSRPAALRRVPFKSFQIYFDDGSALTITRVFEDSGKSPQKPGGRRPASSSSRVSERPRLRFAYKERGRTALTFTEPDSHLSPAYPPSIVDREVPELTRIAPGVWRSMVTGEDLDLDDVLERYGDRLPEGLAGYGSLREAPPAWLVELREKFKVRLIESQRLLVADQRPRPSRDYDRRPQMQEAVSIYASELARTIEARLADYANVAQERDRTFPGRVIGTEATEVSATALRNDLDTLEQRRRELSDAGLLDPGSTDSVPVPATLSESATAVLSVYAEDARAKLSVLDDLAKKVELLKGTLNGRFRFKKVEISRERGIAVRAQDGLLLAPAALSSGEQHEIVLTYELLFRVAPSSLVLIDEPELSLHVAWQEAFLDDLLTMADVGDFDVVIATHSPQIIRDRWDLTVQLGVDHGT